MNMKNNKNAESSHALRISDMVDEPQRMLAPIQGYENLPLVTLEEAVNPLLSIVPGVLDMVYIVKQNCECPEDNLSSDESASIMLYTLEWTPREESFYFIFNKILRGEDRSKLKEWFLYLRLFMTSLSKLPTQRCFVYRGIKTDLSAQYPKGKKFVWWGFTSCTSSIKTLENENFLGKTGTRTLFNIDCQSGKDVRKHSQFPKEDEILLLAARQFEVISCLNTGNGLYFIQLKEIEPPFPFIAKISNINSVVKPSAIVKKEISSYKNPKLEQILTRCQTETTMNLAGNDITDQDMDIVVKQVMNNKQCTELELSGNEIGSQGASLLANVLRNNAELEKLDISNNRIADMGVRSLASVINSSALTTLNLEENSITDEGVQFLADMMKINRTLISLLLNQNKISNRGVQVLATALTEKGTTLEILGLSLNKSITDTSVYALVDMIKCNSSLKKLDLRACGLTKNGEAKIQEAFRSQQKETDVWTSNFF